jgi:hypothetical protein
VPTPLDAANRLADAHVRDHPHRMPGCHTCQAIVEIGRDAELPWYAKPEAFAALTALWTDLHAGLMNRHRFLTDPWYHAVAYVLMRWDGTDAAPDNTRDALARFEVQSKGLTLADLEREPKCTGREATWCPVHGSCTCPPKNPTVEDGERTLDDDLCKLHSYASQHGMVA